ncbi:MAG: O-methyltransferase [bacterium]
MDPKIQAAFDSLQARMAREAALYAELPRAEVERRIDEFMLPIGPETGRLLNMLIKAAGCRSVLEIGTSVGYSTLWLGEAVRETGGRVVSLDANPAKHAEARELLQEAGLGEVVELVTGDALQSLARLEGPFDFVLLDVGRDLYIPCLEAFLPKLAAGGIVAADNMVSPAATQAQAQAYQARVRGIPALSSLLVPIGSGIELSRRDR